MPVFAAACTNILWRIFQGFVFKGVSFDTARTEVQSAANNWLAAWIGCALLLRSRFHWLLPLAVGVLFFGIFVTVTRSLLFPVMASAAASSLCFLLGTRWGIYQPIDAVKRLAPITALVMIAVVGIVLAFMAQPHQIERWNERLFHHASDRNTTEDISYLTRRAEADGIFEILNREPVHYIHGKGIGATYYWHSKYMPAIHLVYPPDEEIGNDVWFAGHSTWTYSIFSGGVIGLLAHLALIGGVMAASLSAARANASDPGPDQWLAFLPFVAACCLLSESLTSNPFDERLAAMIFGVMAGLSQSFLVRASWIHAGPRHSAT
jgi:O-antigen ligase